LGTSPRRELVFRISYNMLSYDTSFCNWFRSFEGGLDRII
jgi:hypothetical protein